MADMVQLGNKQTMKLNKSDQIIWDIYRELYKNSTPSADFDELVNSAEKNSEGQKVIPFNDYEISEEDFNRIIEEQLKGKRLTKLAKRMVYNTIVSGASPAFSKKKFKKYKL
jgi:hypothetical protein